MRTLAVEIECGDKTCASESGKWCHLLRSKVFGQSFWCHLYPHEALIDKDGWLQRPDACLNAEKKEAESEQQGKEGNTGA